MSRQGDLQRARRDRGEGRTGPGQARRNRERQVEVLIAQVLDALAQRDALVDALDLRAGRLLVEITALRWPSARETAAACGITVREAARLRGLAQRVAEPSHVSVPAPNLDGATTASDEE